MHFTLVTVFPELVQLATGFGVIGRAHAAGTLTLDAIDLRDHAVDRHGSVDDRPYGGGAGMVLRPEPLFAAIEAARARQQQVAPGPLPLIVAMSAQGQRFDQALARSLCSRSGLILLAGRYEGFDQRVLDRAVDLELSIGDFVVSGGELPALIVIDAIARLLPGVLGNSASALEESHLEALLEFPQYTRPANHPLGDVPELLVGGDHGRIARWRRARALLTTFRRRPDLLSRTAMSAPDRAALRHLLEAESDGGLQAIDVTK